MAAAIEDGGTVDRALVETIQEEEVQKIAETIGDEAFNSGRFKEAQAIFERVALEDDFEEFLTIPAYEYID
jgi:malate synthase